MNKKDILLDALETIFEAKDRVTAEKLLDKYIEANSKSSISSFDQLTDIIQNNIKAINTDKRMMALSRSMPAARDKLQYVIDESDKRVNDTICRLNRIRQILYSPTINSPQTILEINAELTKILENQEIQDVGAQIIQKAIILVGNLEDQLIKISGDETGIRPTFSSPHQESSQVDIDDLFKKHGN